MLSQVLNCLLLIHDLPCLRQRADAIVFAKLFQDKLLFVHWLTVFEEEVKSWRSVTIRQPAPYQRAVLPIELLQLISAGSSSRSRNLEIGNLALCHLSYTHIL